MTHLLSLGPLLRLARETVTNPREGAETILSLGVPRQALWLAFALVVVLSMILGDVLYLIADVPQDVAQDEPLTGPIVGSPIVLGLLQAAFLYMMAQAITRIGQAFGGSGQFEEAMTLVVWLQFIFILVQLVQLVAVLVLPFAAGFVTVLAVGLFLWLLVNFIATVHGFTSLGVVFAMTIVSAFAILFVLSLLLTMLGITFGTA
jgi:hypothetical protein